MRSLAAVSVLLAGCTAVPEYPSIDVTHNPQAVEEDLLTEIFTAHLGGVDVLFVIDNSDGLFEERNRILDLTVGTVELLLEADDDFHIGVVTTDMIDAGHSGRLRQSGGYRFIDRDTENPSVVMADMASVGQSGHWDERGREAAYAALELRKDGYNIGFSREEADLHVAMISDEDDHSLQPSLSEFLAYLADARAPATHSTVSAVVSEDPLCPTAAEVGTNYVALAQATMGHVISICDDDWGTASDLLPVRQRKGAFVLTEQADPATVVVELVRDDITMLPDEWVWDEPQNAVVFAQGALLNGDILHITYQPIR